MLPTCTVPKFRLVGFEVSVPAAAPVPDSEMVNVGFDAVEIMVIVPLAAPATVGANDALKVALCPAVSVTGLLMPVMLNPVPLVIAT